MLIDCSFIIFTNKSFENDLEIVCAVHTPQQFHFTTVYFASLRHFYVKYQNEHITNYLLIKCRFLYLLTRNFRLKNQYILNKQKRMI